MTTEPRLAAVLPGKVTQFALPADVLAAVREIAGLVHNAYILRETERTKLAVTEAQRETSMRKTKAAERTLRAYLDHIFVERRDAIHALFKGLDAALDRGDTDGVRTVIGGVVDIVRQSPIGPELGDLTRVFGDPTQIWEI